MARSRRISCIPLQTAKTVTCSFDSAVILSNSRARQYAIRNSPKGIVPAMERMVLAFKPTCSSLFKKHTFISQLRIRAGYLTRMWTRMYRTRVCRPVTIFMSNNERDIEGQTRNSEPVESRRIMRHWKKLKLSMFGVGNLQQESFALVSPVPTAAHDGNVSNSAAQAPTSSLYLAAINLLFDLNDAFIEKWPGTRLFLAHIEKELSSSIHRQVDVMRRLLGDSNCDDQAIAWKWCFAVINALEDFEEDKVSIGDVLDKVSSVIYARSVEISPEEFDQVHRAIFAVLCLTSMSLKPVATPDTLPTSSSIPSPWVEGSRQTLSKHALKRPIIKIFKTFKPNTEIVQQNTAVTSPPNPSDVIHESIVNCYSLQRIGRVRLEWVDVITNHLKFDPHTRTLSLFRFPTFCLASVISRKDPAVIMSIAPEILLPQLEHGADDPLYTTSAVHREILLSFRLLFAQSQHSRKLAEKQLRGSRSEADVDPLLFTLCTSPLRPLQRESKFPRDIFPYSTMSADGKLQESDTYSATEDFTFFGSRLISLQRYNSRQQPSKRHHQMGMDHNAEVPLQWESSNFSLLPVLRQQQIYLTITVK
ncbi:hypothetical protein KVR01_006494 [Diaporthe batatas]|uniref:uncharacterized protein n=1 Tax=Diaporthe batatas TaxID=748121 RepID=UPI001D05C200|nr:uncharacterized protein KVR01_006494 [Diaporthe batatas]KAG8163197.1 hypothetical protein KVR01_006494 [Diaporthe batatas]